LLKKALSNREFRFIAVGAVNSGWGLLSFPVFYWLALPFEIGYIPVLIFTYVFNTIFSFATQKYLVFRSSGNHIIQFLKFCSLQAVFLAINLIMLPIAVSKLALNPVIAQTTIAILFMVVTYFFHKLITFRAK
jgi:putative flippase GtrA